MSADDIQRLLDRVGVLRHACDIDLIVFFARHPNTIIASEQLATWLGYDLKQISASLELLMEGALLTRTPTAAHAARLYTFRIGDSGGGGLGALVKAASSREGRLALQMALADRASKRSDGSQAGESSHAPRPFVVRSRPAAASARGAEPERKEGRNRG